MGNFVKLPVSLLGDSEIPPEWLKLWCILKAHCITDTNQCYPSITRLSSLMRYSKKWTWKLLQKMEQAGLLAVNRSLGRVNSYTLKVPDRPGNYSSPVVENQGTTIPQFNQNQGTTVPGSRELQFPLNQIKETDIVPPAEVRTATAKKSRTPKGGDPRIKELIAYFSTKYHETLGAPYTVAWGKDGAAFKTILTDHQPEIIRRCIDLFLEDPDPWLNGKRSVAVFRSRFNQYRQLLAGQRSSQVLPAHRLFLDKEGV